MSLAFERQLLIPVEPAAFVPQPLAGTVHALAGQTMGTTWSVRFCGPARCDIASIEAVLQAELGLVVAQMSHWQPDSLLCRFNHAAAGSWHVLPEPFWQVLSTGLALARLSDGAFDPTLGALIDLWGFGPPGPRAAPPSEAEVDAARARSGWQHLQLELATHRAQQPGGLALDFSGIAKGYAVDRLALALARLGYPGHLVEVGGELRGFGIKPDGQPWWVELEAPHGIALAPAMVALHGLSVATSGDYHRGFQHAGRYYAHTLDPKTGAPLLEAPAAVTVLHRECMLADAWATALTVLPPATAIALADQQRLAARVVGRDGTVTQSVAWMEMLA